MNHWSTLIDKFSIEFPINRLHPQTVDFLSDNLHKPWAIACSGGSDSIALALLIYAHFPSMRSQLTFFHYNHQLRGLESNQDEKFVQEMATELKCKFIVGAPQQPLQTDEGSLRHARHSFFHQQLDENNISILLLGHQKEDIAESMLMRLSRGSNVAGLSAPHPIKLHANKFHYVRPLLSISKTEILEMLKRFDIPWREDLSNRSTHYFRNRVRHELLPVFQRISHTNIFDTLAASRQFLEEDDDALNIWLDSFCPAIEKSSSMDLSFLDNKPIALYRRAIYRWLTKHQINEEVSRTLFQKMLAAILEKEPFSLSLQGKKINYTSPFISLENILPSARVAIWNNVHLTTRFCLALPSQFFISAEVVELDDQTKHDIFKKKYSPDAIVFLSFDNSSRISIRNWIPGDRYQPIGYNQSSKLHDIFINKKVPAFLRTQLPIVLFEEEIAWVPFLPPSEKFKIIKDTKFALKLSYSKTNLN